MQTLQNLKAILHSKRANLYYLEKCRVMQKEGRIVYLAADAKEEGAEYWNIPVANTTCLLLGMGTSITQSAVRMLASAGVMIGFSGNGATPLLMATEIEWLSPQSEYRPTEYIQGWMKWWWDDAKRLEAAKHLQLHRLDFLERVWGKDTTLRSHGFCTENSGLSLAVERARQTIPLAENVTKLLQNEALLTKELYKFACQVTKHGVFTRDKTGQDSTNTFLSHGNYLAYGLGATTLWVLGIPHSFAIMHGKTRRGALVFDIADLIKDTLVLPWAFIAAKEGLTEQEFRSECLHAFTDHKAMDFMFEITKNISQEGFDLEKNPF